MDPVEDWTPRVIYSGGLDELEIELSFPTPVFGFEAEPFSLDPSLFGKDEFEIRVEFHSPSGKESEIEREWDGIKQSAALIAGLSLGDPFTWVHVRAKGLPDDPFSFGVGGFGMANFRYWSNPVPPEGPTLEPIPEPATTWLLFSGLVLLVGMRRTRQALGRLAHRAGRQIK